MEKECFVEARDGLRLGYKISRVEGARHSLVMLNGLASNSTRWTEFVNGTALKQCWNLMRHDRRGHGITMYRGRISRPIWREDLDTIIEHEKLAPVVLLGHSLGTELALDYVTRYPEKVEALILVDPVFPKNLTGLLGFIRHFRWLLWIPIVLLWILNSLGLRRRSFPPRDLYADDMRAREKLAANPEMDLADLYMNPLGDLPYIPLANYLQDLHEVVRPLPPLAPITQPVLVILSASSSISDKARNEARIAEFPNASVEWVVCDHWPLTEKPEEVRRIIDEWCLTNFP